MLTIDSQISLRIPEELRAAEPHFRGAIQKKLNRGRVDGTLKFSRKLRENEALELDEDLIGQLIEAGSRIQDMADANTPTLAPLAVNDVLNWQGVVRLPMLDEEAVQTDAGVLLQQVLDDLVVQRQREGGKLGEIIAQRIDAAEVAVAKVQTFLPEISAAVRKRLEEQLAKTAQQVDQSRLEQETVFHLTKQDVMEEMDRLKLHLIEVKNTLKSKQPIGRKLDFLLQELNREANTLGSKSVDVRTTDASVQLKILIEQMREQVQNLE
ncbi:MAG: YicC/YloC family endoribonuclease [Arenicellales bacterium WSBS_2016_MAG_OTU3]